MTARIELTQLAKAYTTMTKIDFEQNVGEHIEENPWRARVFSDFGIDFVSVAETPLDEICEAHGLETRELRRQLTALEQRDDASKPVQFSNLTQLVDYIEEHHHAFLKEELAPLRDYVERLHDSMGDHHSRLSVVVEQLTYLAEDLPAHLDREENILFPAVRGLEDNAEDEEHDSETARELLVGLEEDHDNYEKSLWQIRDVTDNYDLPGGLDAEQRTRYINMLARLEGLERDIQMHIHRENNVLFRNVRRET